MPKLQTAAEYEFMPSIKPAKSYVPSWYAKAKSFIGGKPDIVDGRRNVAIKSCVPFMDAYLTGYTAELWCDLQVVQTISGPEIRWVHDIDPPISSRSSEISDPMPTPNGYNNKHYVWHNPYLLKTPPGYSLLITHPLNQYDLPFFTLSGVVDSDKDLMPAGRLPFFIKEGFEGFIPKGTPIFQIIPMKRESWKAEESADLRRQNQKRLYNVATVLHGWYRSNVWTKKEYN